MNAVMQHRRHPLAFVVLLLAALVAVGGLYAAAAPGTAEASGTDEYTGDELVLGADLFRANCATCHGFDGAGGSVDEISRRQAGPSLWGVGAASVDFQVGTGRMPAQASGPQIQERAPQFTLEETRALAAYVATEFGPGPAIPGEEFLDPAEGDVAEGAELFRVNCAMCHNFAGSGGALTRGKYAPDLTGTEPVYIYEAMLTGPQSMPVFSDAIVTPEQKQDMIAYLEYLDTTEAPGGLTLGSLGPVSEGLVAWLVGIGGLIGCAVWLGAKSS